MRVSSVGELGYELHLEARHCVTVYNKLMKIGVKYELKNAGFRALNSLNCENGLKISRWNRKKIPHKKLNKK